jgi:hypothetical protein
MSSGRNEGVNLNPALDTRCTYSLNDSKMEKSSPSFQLFQSMLRIFFRLIEEEGLTEEGLAEKGVLSREEAHPAGLHAVRELQKAFLTLLTEGEDTKSENTEGENTEARKRDARRVLESYKNHPSCSGAAAFFEKGLEVIPPEIEKHAGEDVEFRETLERLGRLDPESVRENGKTRSAYLREVRNCLFPEGAGLEDEKEQERNVEALRKKRRITIEEMNPRPLEEPAKELLFTSNVLLTTPLTRDLDTLPISESVKQKAADVLHEKQRYWYDHPIPLGIETEKNEAVYGLGGLNRMIEREKEWGTVPADAKMACVLSLSVTHTGLHDLAKEYFSEELQKAGPFLNLDVYMITESDCRRLLDEVLIPAARHWFPEQEGGPIEGLKTVFGVDGEYGRHYSFLKAVSALWQACYDPEVKATFKIDLDQVFPQNELKHESGSTALEHFTSPLWGAKGRDSEGRQVELGMIAGALVNQDDIEQSLFTPDVRFPEGTETAEEHIFYSKLPQALSTEAEMMMRYDGGNHVIQRVHVTGGTNGILIDSLQRHRPFTPSVIGRAEDQSYLLSVLYSSRPALRYLHKPGLIMRHDKHGFATEAIEKAAVQREVGDFIRMVLFSFYARALPWSVAEIKSAVDPFTGCFISYIPFTVVSLRFSAKLADLLERGEAERAEVLLQVGGERLLEIANRYTTSENPLADLYRKEKAAWDLYYDVVDKIEAESLVKRCREIFDSCRITE